MSILETNPFPISQYMGTETFCDRINETSTLISGLENGRNFTLLSIRRMGKTGLIRHVLNKISSKNDTFGLYIDIQFTQNQSDFSLLLAKEIARNFPIHRGIGKKFIAAIGSLRPKISFDALTGTPELSLDVSKEQIKENTIQDILFFLDAQNIPIVIAIDEFQQILKYPEKNTEAMLRATMQQVTNLKFIYCGSDQHLMHELFNSAKRPFFASCSPMYLHKIDTVVYSEFILKIFTSRKRNISIEAIDLILQLTFVHTYYTQSLCHHLYQNGIKKIGVEEVNHTLLEILKEYEPYYYQLRNLLTDSQWNLLKALAVETSTTQPYHAEFIKKHNLSSSASVKRSLDSLLQKELVYCNPLQDQTEYVVYDKFMLHWLGRLPFKS